MRLVVAIMTLSFALALLASVGIGVTNPPDTKVAPVWERIASDDAATATQAAAEYTQLRERMVAALVKILRDFPQEEKTTNLEDLPHERVERITRTIRLLGEMRADSAAPVLTKFLLFNARAGFGPPSMMPVFGPEAEDNGLPLFPAIDALIKIGKPSIRPCLSAVAAYLDSLPKPRSEEERLRLVLSGSNTNPVRFAATVIVRIEGQPGAEFLLQQLILNEPDDKLRLAAERLMPTIRMMARKRPPDKPSDG